MIRVDRLVVPEEKSFCSTSSVRLLHCAHSRAMATPLMPPPMTRTSKGWSCDWIKPLTLLLFRCFLLKGQHYFRTQHLRNRVIPESKAFKGLMAGRDEVPRGLWPTGRDRYPGKPSRAVRLLPIPEASPPKSDGWLQTGAMCPAKRGIVPDGY